MTATFSTAIAVPSKGSAPPAGTDEAQDQRGTSSMAERKTIRRRNDALVTATRSRRSPVYVPSEDALLLARLHDGLAVERAPSVTEDDLENARHVLRLLHDAVRYGFSARKNMLDLLVEAAAVPAARTNGERLLRYVESVEHAVKTWGPYEAASVRARATEADILRHAKQFTGKLVAFDPAFEKLTGERYREAMRAAFEKLAGAKYRDVDGLRMPKGGAGNTGIDHVAAELAIEVDAFAFVTRTGDYDADVDRFKDRLRSERRRA